MSAVAIKFAGLGVALGCLTVLWAFAVKREDASLVDRVWGLLFLLEAVTWALLGDGLLERRVLLVAMVAVWSLRLSGYITRRNWGGGEDKRYAAMRARNPERFPRRSLVTVFWLQGLLAFVIGGPLYYPMLRADTGLNWVDGLAVVVFVVGFSFEAVGDWQLSRFLADESNRGKVMDQGLWRYTRHPNYFGDTVVWVGFALVSVASGAWWGIYGAVLMGIMIVRVSGVALTDKVMSEGSSREGHDEYVRRTNAFFPGPPDPG